MLIDTIRNFFKKSENFLLILTGFFFTLNSLFYVGREVFDAKLFFLLSFRGLFVIYVLIFLFFLFSLFHIFKNPVKMFPFLGKLIFVFLPSVLIWSYGFSQSVHFPLILRLASDFFLIFTCFYFLFKYAGYKNIFDFLADWKNESISSDSKNGTSLIFQAPSLGSLLRPIRRQGTVAMLILTSVVILNLGFGLFHLSEFAAVDEPLWVNGRITKFWNNVLDGEWEKTTVSDKPGITVAILSGAGLIFENPKDYNFSNSDKKSAGKFKDIRSLNFAMRFPILIFNALMLLVFYSLLKKLLGKTASLLSTILIGLSPLLLGISTIVNPDSLLWVFMPLSLISHFIYLKNSKNKYLYLSGIFLGLAILTKYVANFLYVFYFGLIFLEYVINNDKYKSVDISSYFKKAFGDYIVLIFFSLLTYFILLPAVWYDLTVVFEGTLLSKAFIKVWPIFIFIVAFVAVDIQLLKNKITAPVLNFLGLFKGFFIKSIAIIFALAILAVLINTYSGMKFLDFESILASPKSSYAFTGFVGLMLANVYSLIFGIIPAALLAIIFLSFKILTQKPNENVIWSFYLMIFILLYYLASTINDVSATVRYQIIIYPLSFILASLGIYELLQTKLFKKYLKESFAILLVLIASLFSLNSIRPFYFSYASDLLPKKYVLNLKDMGDGSYEAAQFLNSLPNAKNIQIWTDKRGVCAFFVGICHDGFDFATQEMTFDYFVVSAGRESRTTKMTLARYAGGNTEILRIDKLYSEEESVYKLSIGGRPNNFVKIISWDQLAN